MQGSPESLTPVKQTIEEECEGHTPWSYTEFGTLCSCGAAVMGPDEECQLLTRQGAAWAGIDDVETWLSGMPFDTEELTNDLDAVQEYILELEGRLGLRSDEELAST